MSKKKPYRIPFYQKDMMEFTYSKPGEIATGEYSYGKPTEWRDNYEFEATIKITGTYRGRSAARATCVNLENEETYSMGLASFYEAIRLFGARKGAKIKGLWTFRKQGANYGLYPVNKGKNK